MHSSIHLKQTAVPSAISLKSMLPFTYSRVRPTAHKLWSGTLSWWVLMELPKDIDHLMRFCTSQLYRLYMVWKGDKRVVLPILVCFIASIGEQAV